MLLFLKDWNNYGNAIVDTQTKNKSFIRLSALYKSMGIKNHAFILALLNPKLQGVDPFSDDLTIEEMAMIAIECRQNFFYFVREVARAPAPAGLMPAMVEANRGNVALWWSFFNHITFIFTAPRQTGKSFSTDLLMTALMNFLCNNTQINLLTKDDILRGANIKRLKEIYDELPPYLNFKSREDSNNTEALSVKKFNNTYLTHVPQASPKRAYNVGRGLTSPIFHIDEPPFQSNIHISMPAALAAMGAAWDIAEQNNEPHGIILTTTAGKKDSIEGKYIYTFAQEAAIWSDKFLDCNDSQELMQLVCQNSRRGAYRVYGNFSHRQLGKTDEWLKQKIDLTGQSGDDANRDYFGIWTSGTITSPIPTHLLEKMNASIVSEEFQQISPINSYVLRWYIQERDIPIFMQTHKLVIGVDTSDASGGDDISLVMVDVENGAVIAIGTFNETNLITFAQWLVYLLITYVNTTMIIERRSSGITILDYLLLFLPQKGIDPFERLFNWVVNDHMENQNLWKEVNLPMRKREESLYVRAKKNFGFATSGGGQTSRSELYSTTLQNAIKRCSDKIFDRSLTEQISSLVNRNGRVDHDIGGHDDLCFIGSTLIRTINGNVPIKDVKIGDLILTRKGYKPVIKLFCSEKEVIEKYGLIGTPNHPFITPDGEIQFKDLNLESKVYKWNEKLSIIEEKTITDILNLSDHNLETTSIGMINGKNHLSHYIDRYMKTHMGLYQKDIKFTIKMAISIIIKLKTSNALLLLNTENFIQCLKKLVKREQRKTKREIHSVLGGKITQSLLNQQLLETGVNLRVLRIGEKITQILPKSNKKRVKNILQNGEKKTLNSLYRYIKKQVQNIKILQNGESKIQILQSKYMQKMEEKLKVNLLIYGEKKTMNSQRVYTQKVVEKAEKQKERKEIVYNLMVADCHEYFVNDILVHNCIGFLLCHWFLTMAKNLNHYGINSKNVMIEHKQRIDITPDNAYLVYEQQNVRTRIEEIYEQLKIESDEYIVDRLEKELYHLDTKIILNDGEYYSVDAIINDAKDKRKQKNKVAVTGQDIYSRFGYRY